MRPLTVTSRTPVADRAANFLARRIDRRGVLKRSALVGSALAVAPTEFVFKPRTAYAAICQCSGSTCDCGAACCDGYTEFCCTISGRNQCPPGTLLGGWWKVDGSSFCGGGPRYYMDCNATCGGCGCGSNGICAGSCSGTGCGCANGDCGNRKAGCTGFRYGQCHQEIACLGPIVCRVITCTPPWQLDATCTTAVRTDNNTRYHDAPCLRGDPVGSIEAVQRRPDGIRIVGWALDPDVSGPVDVHAYINGQGRNLGQAGLHRPDVAALYPMHPNCGFDVVVPWTERVDLNVCVYAINQGSGGNVLLACRSTPLSPLGWVDTVKRAPGGIAVAGWALDPESADPIDIHVYVNGVGTNLGPARLARGDVGARYPQWGAAHGFAATIPWSGEGSAQVCVYAINVGGGGHSLLGCHTLAVAHTPFGTIDQVHRVPGGLRVVGWAIDPDTTAAVDVHVYANGRGTNLGPADAYRGDVGQAYPDWGSNHGFDAVIPWSEGGVVELCAYGINLGTGGNSLLACRRVEVGHEPYGVLDVVERVAGGLRVAGWAIDPDTADPIDVHVYVNGTGFNLGPANIDRGDVGQRAPAYGGRHGFDTVLPWSAPGAATACAYAINTGAGSNHTAIGCRSVS